MKRSYRIYSDLKILLFVILFLNVQFLFAQENEPGDKTLSPYFFVYSDNPEVDNLPLKETTAQVNITGVIADVTIRQTYVNNGKSTLEAVYVFPMSTKAAVYGMQMTIGKRTLTAQIKEKKQARKDYEKAKSEGRRTSLLEQNRPNVFKMNVANIVADDEIVVELKYTELLVPEKGMYSFVYPAVVGPRYSNQKKETASTDDKFVASPYTKAGENSTYKFGINITINSAIPIQNVTCKTHKPEIQYSDLYTANLYLKPSNDSGNRDVIVDYSLQGEKIESGVMLFESKDENFFLLMMQPPKKILPNAIPPREYIFIVDVSGSMRGFPLEVTKKLMRNLIVNLKPTDKFNVVLFESRPEQLSETSLSAIEENVDKAINFIDTKSGGGGTELMDALKKAYTIPRQSDNLSRSFVIVTDGYVDVEKEAFDFIRNNSNNANFFSFGIGSGVNRHLIEGLAFVGHGEAMVITNTYEAEKLADAFRNYINTPVLTQVRVDYGLFDVYDVEPISVPDLLAERPLIIFGKYKGKPTGTITIEGKTGGKPYRQSFNLFGMKADDKNAAIRYLWARERIKLLDYNNTRYGWSNYSRNDEKIKREITSLGLKYGLMTAYTSFIAVDDEKIKNPGELVPVNQPLPMPQDVSNYAIDNNIEIEELYILSDDVEVEEESDVVLFSVVETMPQYPGGNNGLIQYIGSNLIYPAYAQENGIQGRVIVQFWVETDGTIKDVVVVRGIDPSLDQEAIRIVKSMPKWKPAMQRGKPTRVKYTLPITFKLN